MEEGQEVTSTVPSLMNKKRDTLVAAILSVSALLVVFLGVLYFIKSSEADQYKAQAQSNIELAEQHMELAKGAEELARAEIEAAERKVMELQSQLYECMNP